MTWFLLDAPLIVAFLLFLMVLDKLLFSCFKLMAESEPEFFFLSCFVSIFSLIKLHRTDLRLNLEICRLFKPLINKRVQH